MHIIGLTGPIGSGKTTLADFLATQAPTSVHYESWLIIAEVANGLRSSRPSTPAPDDIDGINDWLSSLPELVEQYTHAAMSAQACQLTLKKLAAHPEQHLKLLEYLAGVQEGSIPAIGDITDVNKESCRSILQWLGGYLVIAVKPTIWYDEIVRRLQANPPDALITVGGVRYPADAACLTSAGGVIIKIERPDQTVQDATDLTERERDLIKPTVLVHNNGSVEDLKKIARTIYVDLLESKLNAAYSA